MIENKLVKAGNWIWLNEKETLPDSFAAFRRKIDIATEKKVSVAISADSNFELYVNGRIIPGNQFSDYPERKTYTVFDISKYVVKGENTIAVLVHFIGENFLRDLKGYPGLWAVVFDDDHIIDASSADWLSCRAPGFQSGNQIKFTTQLGFATVFDACENGAVDWMIPEFDDSGWKKSVDVSGEYPRTLSERPLPCLTDCGFKTTYPVQYGFLIRQGIAETPSEQMWKDYLHSCLKLEVLSDDLHHLYTKQFEVYSITQNIELHPDGSGLPFCFRRYPEDGSNGYYVIVDLKKETTGFIGFKVRCSEGTVIDYALGEHLMSGRVRTKISYRNLSDRYICREGENEFQLRVRRCAGRYLELHFTETAYPPEIIFAGVAEQLYPLENETVFKCPDQLRLKTAEIAVRTLVNCMHEHYEDCPWREQALYAYDSRNQALYGYYVWGNWRFAEVSFDLIGKSMLPNGFLALTSPGGIHVTIPGFSFAWVSEICEWYWHSGSLELFKRNAPVVRQLLDFVLSKQTASGLYTPGCGEGIWNFSEWVEGLSSGNCEEIAPYNLYLYEALLNADEMFRASGIDAPDYAGKAQVLGKVIEKQFYLPEAGCYASVTGPDAGKLLHEHTQALMLFNGLVPEEKIPPLLEKIMYHDDLIKCSFSSMPFLIRALMRFDDRIKTFASERVSSAFDGLTLIGRTTLDETSPEDAIVGEAKSLCHAWSSLPVYFNKRYILGVKPLEPGFKKFTVTPFCSGMAWAKGEVPTPCGNIKVEWKMECGKLDLKVEAPEGTVYIK